MAVPRHHPYLGSRPGIRDRACDYKHRAGMGELESRDDLLHNISTHVREPVP
jgi:hypothetical protein